MVEVKPFKPTETTKMMSLFNDALYLCGMPNFWVEIAKFSENFIRRYNVFSNIIHLTNGAFTLLLLAAFLTQKDLNTKQQSDIFVVNLAFPTCHFYCGVLIYHRAAARDILYRLMIRLKEDHNDSATEKQTIKKFKFYVAFYSGFACVTATYYAVYALALKILKGMPFVTIITAWPDVRDESMKAEIARVIIYIYWWISLFGLTSSLLVLVCMLIGVSQQFKNLQCYFYDLEKIFHGDLSQEEKEQKFENGFIKGVKMHVETIWCLNEIKRVCQLIFDAHMILSLTMFVSLLSMLMNPDRDLGSVLATVLTSIVCLIALGYIMWNGGDVYVEASLLPEAIYGSGWQNCYIKSTRIRKLVVIAMSQAQQPVILKALGVIELSYNGYLGIIKASHSVFTVMY